jgi:hypothetical protein
VVLGSHYSVGEVALSGEVDVSEFVLKVKTSLHLGIVISLPACFHYYGYQ